MFSSALGSWCWDSDMGEHVTGLLRLLLMLLGNWEVEEPLDKKSPAGPPSLLV